MPELLILSLSEKIIINVEDHSLSIISLFDSINVAVTKDDIVPSDAIVPTPWSVLALWHIDDRELGSEFEQRLSLVFPDDSTKIQNMTTFTANSMLHRANVKRNFFPIGQQGRHYVIMEIRQAGTDQEFQIKGRYPLTVNYQIVSEEEAAEPQNEEAAEPQNVD